MCTHNPWPQGEKSLKQATCELIGETRITNELLRTVIEKLGGRTAGERFKEDEQAFIAWWSQIPFRFSSSTSHPSVKDCREAWSAALDWERSKK